MPKGEKRNSKGENSGEKITGLELLFENKKRHIDIKGQKSNVHEEYFVKGDRGVMIKYYHKDKDGIEKILIVGRDDKFILKTMNGDNTDEKTITKDELVKEVSKNKKLAFAKELINEVQLGGKKRSRKGSKKVSKKSSRKGSKKGGSRKGSKKGTKKRSKKGSKKN